MICWRQYEGKDGKNELSWDRGEREEKKETFGGENENKYNGLLRLLRMRIKNEQQELMEKEEGGGG